jgi:hypothetical protein
MEWNSKKSGRATLTGLKKLLLVSFFLPLTGTSLRSTHSIQSIKLNPSVDNSSGYQLELGTIRLKCKGTPLVNLLPSNNPQETVLFLPQATIHAQCASVIHAINSTDYGLYRVQIEPTKTPIKGVCLHIAHDENKVKVIYETVHGSDFTEEVIIHFYNKELLKQLEQQSRAMILHT